jgi:hypothetical protein
LPALFRRVAGLAEIVLHVLELDRLVIALDREDLAQHRLQAVVLALLDGNVVLEKRFVAGRLDLGEVGDRKNFSAAAETTNFLELQASLCWNRHRRRSSRDRCD